MEARIFFRWNDSTDLKFHHKYYVGNIKIRNQM